MASLVNAVETDQIVCIPLSGHKHVVPFAQWGRVNTDNQPLRWTGDDADLLRVMHWLRRLGFGER
jgi:hypothetical protein